MAKPCDLDHIHACPFEGTSASSTPVDAFCPCHSAHAFEAGGVRGLARRVALHGSLETALRVLAAVDALPASPADAHALTASAFSNGREQGLMLSFEGAGRVSRCAAVAEDRSAGDIVVYAGGAADFDYATHMPSRRVFERGVHRFAAGDCDGAARFLERFLTTGASAPDASSAASGSAGTAE